MVSAPRVNITPTALHGRKFRRCIPTLFTPRLCPLDVRGVFANRKSDFHEALYDARVYSIIILHRPRRARQQDGGLRQQARRIGKPLITLDSPANGNLVELGLVVAKAGSDGMLLSRSTKRLTDRISIMKGDETFFLLFPMQVSRV